METPSASPATPTPSPWLRRIPSIRTPAGREWTLLKRMPHILLWGTLLPALVSLALHLLADSPADGLAADRTLLLADYMLLGVVVLHWTLVLTASIGCVIVMIAKGPAFVADPYYLDEQPKPPAPTSGRS